MSKPYARRRTATTRSILLSPTLRLLSIFSLTTAPLRPATSAPLLGTLVPLLYLFSIPDYVRAPDGPVVEQREVVQVVPAGKGNKRRTLEKNEGVQTVDVKRDVYIRREGEEQLHHVEPIPKGSLTSAVAGWPTTARAINGLSLLLNTLLVLFVLDQNWSPLLMKHSDLVYARAGSLTPHTASLNFRLPPGNPYASTSSMAEVVYRPLLTNAAVPVPWEHSSPVPVSQTADWRGKVDLDGLGSGVTYQYRLKNGDGSYWPQHNDLPLNFTTFPDPRLSRRSNFKFIHASGSRRQQFTYSPYKLLQPLLLPLLPSSEPHTFPSPGHLLHRWKAYHVRQPGWRVLSDWLADMRERTAWAQVQFGLVGDEIEQLGTKRGPMGSLERKFWAQSREFMSSRDVRDVYETLPIIPSRVHSPSEGGVLEPAALSAPESSFAYADAHFYRLRRPSIERSAKESQDWLADLSDLSSWIAKVNSTSGFKFVLSSTPLSPFIPASDHEISWRDAVLDLLRYVPNVIVLSESRDGFTVSQLRKSVLEIASPPLSSPSPPPWHRPSRLNRYAAHEEPVSIWTKADGQVVEEVSFVKIDHLVRHISTRGGAAWSSIEVDTTGTLPRVYATFWVEGKEVGKLEVVGQRRRGGSTGVGSLAEGLSSMLRRFGLISSRWF